MQRGMDLLRRQARARTSPGAPYGAGVVVAYDDRPNVLIRRDDGSQFWWHVALCDFGEVVDDVPAMEEPQQAPAQVPHRVQDRHQFYIISDKNEYIATLDVDRKRGGLWLTNFWVHADHRKQGLGRQIFTHVVKRYSNEMLYLQVSPYMNAPMDEDQLIAFYSSFGFHCTDVPDVMVREKA